MIIRTKCVFDIKDSLHIKQIKQVIPWGTLGCAKDTPVFYDLIQVL